MQLLIFHDKACAEVATVVAPSLKCAWLCRLRQLVRRLETSVGVRPWPKPIKNPGDGSLSFGTLYYMGLKKRSTQMTATTLSRASNSSVNLNGPVNEFRHLVMSWDDWQEGMDVVVRHMKQKDLPSFVFADGMGFSPVKYAQRNQPFSMNNVRCL